MIEEILIEDEKMEGIVQDVSDNKIKEQESLPKPKIKFGDVMFNRKIKVFVKVNSEGFVTNVSNDVFLKDTSGWILIDEGEGNRYNFAQTEYFEKPLLDEEGNYQIKFEK